MRRSLLAASRRARLPSPRGEVVVDEPTEMLLEQTTVAANATHDGTSALPFLLHVAAILDGLDDRQVGRPGGRCRPAPPSALTGDASV